MPPSLKARRRIVGLFLGAMLVCMALFVRLGYVTLLSGPELAKAGLEARLRSIPLLPPRGDIVDAEGHVLASSRASESVYAIPAQVSDPDAAAAALAPVLGVPSGRLEHLLGLHRSVVWLKRRASPAETVAIRTLALPGVGVVTGSRRDYPYGSLASFVLGYTGVDDQGLDGLELVYDRELRGQPGAIRVELDARNRPIPRAREYFKPPVKGGTLKLTLSLPIERIAAREAEQALQETQAVGTAVIVMDVKTGGIVALAAAPSFDPNRYQRYPQGLRRDWVVSDTFPPGSTFKIVTAAAALETGVATLDSRFYDPGFAVVNGVRLRCWKAGGHGAVDFVEVVHRSCNVGFVDLGLRLGTERFYAYLRRFHLLAPTGVDLPGEAAGIVPPKARVTPVDLATMAFGQTLSLTPLQLLSAVAAVADGGVWNRPHIMQAFLSPHGKVLRQWSVKGERVLAPQVARQLAGVLGGVVAEGTGQKGQVVGYRLAGKTGTAQAVINGRYVEGKYVASFVGFGPLPDPKFAVLVLINQPQGLYYGGQIAAPVFARVMGQILSVTDTPPDPSLTGLTEAPDLVGMTVRRALAALKAAGLRARTVGGGEEVSGQFPAPGTVLQRGAQVLLFGTSETEVVVPDLVGKDVATALSLLDRMNLRAVLVGSGRVTAQRPSPGTRVRTTQTVFLLARPSAAREGAP